MMAAWNKYTGHEEQGNNSEVDPTGGEGSAPPLCTVGPQGAQDDEVGGGQQEEVSRQITPLLVTTSRPMT